MLPVQVDAYTFKSQNRAPFGARSNWQDPPEEVFFRLTYLLVIFTVVV